VIQEEVLEVLVEAEVEQLLQLDLHQRDQEIHLQLVHLKEIQVELQILLQDLMGEEEEGRDLLAHLLQETQQHQEDPVQQIQYQDHQ
jgi:hypothetical protein